MTKNQTIALGVAILLILGVLAYNYLNPAQKDNMLTAQANGSVEEAWESLISSKSAHIVANLDISIPHSEAQAANQPVVDIAIATEGDGTWRERPTYAGKFNITTKGRGMQLFTDGEIYILPTSAMFKLQNLPTLLNPSGNLLNKWTNVDGTLLRTTNPEQLQPVLTSLFSNWTQTGTDNSLAHYEKTISEDEERQLESTLKIESSGSEAMHILARLVKNFNIQKAEAWLTPDTKQLRQIQFNFASSAEQDQTATLQFTFSDQGKDVALDIPKAESTVQPSIFTQLFGEPKPSPTPAPKTSSYKKRY